MCRIYGDIVLHPHNMSLCKEYKILFNYKAREPDEINLKKGKVGPKIITTCSNIIDGVLQYVRVLSKNEEDENYWKGEADGKMGLFPKDFVREVSQKKTECHAIPIHVRPNQEPSKTASKSPKEIVNVRKEICQVIYDYEAENDDELTIKQKEVYIFSKYVWKHKLIQNIKGCNNSGQKCREGMVEREGQWKNWTLSKVLREGNSLPKILERK